MIYSLSIPTIFASTARFEVSAPMNTVNIGTMLAVHCQIPSLQKGDHVSMFRTLEGYTEMLTVNEDVIPSIEDRVFLAFRNMADGTISYFLSITGVVRSDEGSYECKVLRGIKEIVGGVVNITVNYFAVEQNPVCTSESPNSIKHGSSIKLNCTSPSGSPPVQIQWTQTRDGLILKSNQTTVNELTYAESVITLTDSDRDNNAVFLCTVTSPAFPGIQKTCIVGPFTVSSNDKDKRHGKNPAVGNTNSNGQAANVGKTVSNTQCKDLCSFFTAPVFQWMLASAITGILALFFCFVGIILFFKYNRLHSSNKEADIYQSESIKTEGIYDEVDVKPYMTLQRQPDPLNKDMQFIGYYRFTPKQYVDC